MDKTLPLEPRYREQGFSLLEMAIVLAIIGILVMATIPSSDGKIDQAHIGEALSLVGYYQQQVEQYYSKFGEFPKDNESAGMPEAQSIMGNYLAAVYQEDGALHLELGNKIRTELRGKTVSIRPIFVPGTENTPVSWICGSDTVPPNMLAAGENRTNVARHQLPVACR